MVSRAITLLSTISRASQTVLEGRQGKSACHPFGVCEHARQDVRCPVARCADGRVGPGHDGGGGECATSLAELAPPWHDRLCHQWRAPGASGGALNSRRRGVQPAHASPAPRRIPASCPDHYRRRPAIPLRAPRLGGIRHRRYRIHPRAHLLAGTLRGAARGRARGRGGGRAGAGARPRSPRATACQPVGGAAHRPWSQIAILVSITS
jgi:hypothetical protein